MLLPIYFIPLFLFWLSLCVYLLINTRRICYLKNLRVDPTMDASVTIIIPVRNEEGSLKQALSSVCKLAYKNYNVIVVNDRSTDRSGEILRDINKEHNLQVIDVTELPEGWLGKNHALYSGAQNSSSRYFLF